MHFFYHAAIYPIVLNVQNVQRYAPSVLQQSLSESKLTNVKDFFLLLFSFFFSASLVYKSGHTYSLQNMQSFTSRADELYRHAEDERFEILVYTEPYTSCYDALLEQQEVYNSAREMEQSAREIRQKFQEISESGFPIHTSSMLRKVLSAFAKGSWHSITNS